MEFRVCDVFINFNYNILRNMPAENNEYPPGVYKLKFQGYNASTKQSVI